MVADPEPTYAVDDLLREAAGIGAPASSRLITDWVAKGLLDKPTVRGLGRGSGTSARWSEAQRRLFLELLAFRQQGVTRIPPLCNLPVTWWLDSEPLERDVVPLRQVRRCMRTWTGAYRTGSGSAARYTAQQLIEQQGRPELSRRTHNKLIDAVMRATGGGTPDQALLRTAAQEAFHSERFAETWSRTVNARLLAIAKLDELDDDAFDIARSMVNQAADIYVTRELSLAGIRSARHERSLELLNELVNNACLGLLTVLGLANNPTPPP